MSQPIITLTRFKINSEAKMYRLVTAEVVIGQYMSTTAGHERLVLYKSHTTAICFQEVTHCLQIIFTTVSVSFFRIFSDIKG